MPAQSAESDGRVLGMRGFIPDDESANHWTSPPGAYFKQGLSTPKNRATFYDFS